MTTLIPSGFPERRGPRPLPDLSQEQELRACGYRWVAGVDEAGRGAWAGPVYAAAVVLPLDRSDLPALLADVRDSKQLSPSQREALYPLIREVALAVGVGWAEVEEIHALGILAATRLAMVRAVAQLDKVDALLIDHIHLPEIPLPQRSLSKADQRCLSVAAASIIAKVERDRKMVELDRQYPGYGFAAHKGYGTPQHRWALERLGPSPVHRRTWRPIALQDARSFSHPSP
ncbi:MAG: ribonuclease HII [Anaerolineae bacterium]|nr:ribonuclease HII [Anaerolineae bacterium]MCX8066406.1 ribonuclease HII [Anaerolineae bacterium]